VTLTPSSDFGIRGEPGKAYDVNPVCAAPGCRERSVHGHHLWARSHLRGQPQDWVKLPDGTILGNRTGLCLVHHNAVTGGPGGHQARVVFKQGLFWWEVKTTSDTWGGTGLLDPQPPGVTAEATTPAASRAVAPAESACPTCGHVRKREHQPRRKSKTWTLEVPDDAEHGAEILDEWADSIAWLLGFQDERSRLRRYHAIATALFWVMQSRDKFLAELDEAVRGTLG
jgi:hypothetical protein